MGLGSFAVGWAAYGPLSLMLASRALHFQGSGFKLFPVFRGICYFYPHHPVHPNTIAMFAISLITAVGNGTNTLFWSDHWLLVTSLEELAPNVLKTVPLRVRKSRTMAEALIDHAWVSDIRGALSWLGLMELLSYGTQFLNFSSLMLKFSIVGSMKTRVFSPPDQPVEPSSLVPSSLNLGSSCANLELLTNARFSFGLLCAIAVGQRITYSSGDCCIQSIVLFATRTMKQPSTSSTLVYLLGNFGSASSKPLNLPLLVPTRRTISFADWWKNSWKKMRKQHRKGFNSLIILGAWILWKHRYSCVFGRSAPNVQSALQAFKDESHLWIAGGAKGLGALEQPL